MDILITGIAGSLGSFLLDDLLEREHNIVGIDNLFCGRIDNIEHNLSHKRFKFIKSDLIDFDYSILGQFDCICHMAALKKIGDMSTWKRTDLLMNNLAIKQLLDFAIKNSSKFVFASTSDVYGTSEDLPFSEDGDIRIGPSDVERWDYAASKLFDEHMCFSYADDYNLPVSVIRYFGAYSDRANYKFGEHVPLFIKKALDREPIIVHGDGLQTRSMCHVSDAIRATISVIEKDSSIGHIINIGSDEEMSILDTAKLIWGLINEDEPQLEFVPIKKVFGKYREIKRRVPDLSKAKDLLGYEPEISFKEGLIDVINKIRRINE